MPATVNGVGTHYYGKKNVEERAGVCEHCGKEVRLRTYETRLWFVVLFIPIIPLGKKQILDECSRCTMHRALPLEEWERIKREAVSETVGKASQNPDDPEAAIDLLGTLHAFKRRDEARDLAAIMKQKFADSADVQLHLAAYYDETGEHQTADGCYDRAFELEPANHGARRAIAFNCIQKGDVDRAAELLDFMMSPGPDQDPAVLGMLAAAYQEQRRDEEALKVHEVMLRSAPGLGKNGQFRKAVRSSEKALGRGTTMLPRSTFLKRAAIVAGVIALIAAALFGIDAFLAARQTLYIFNALPQPSRVEIDGHDPLTIPANGRGEMIIGEGQHTARITREGAPDETVLLLMGNRFEERWGGSSVFILNVGGAATFQWQEIIYSVRTPGREPRGGLLLAETFLAIRNIDYAFEGPPKKISTEDRDDTVKRHVELVSAAPSEILGYLMQERPPDESIRYAERHLALGTLGDNGVRAYYVMTLKQDQTERCRKFLEGRLDDRPVRVEWHRFYQELCDEAGAEAELIAKYDSMLAEDPRSSALLYLRGRVEPDSTAAMKYFERASEADASDPHPWRARGYAAAIRGDFAEAKELYAKAAALKPDDWVMESAVMDMRVALGEHKEIEAESKAALGKDPFDAQANGHLLHALAAQGRLDAAEKAHHAFVANLKTSEGPHPYALGSRLNLLYLKGDNAAIASAAGGMDDKAVAARTRFFAYLETGDLRRAAADLAKADYARSHFDDLLMSVAWRRRGNATETANWRKRAIDKLGAGDRGERRTADLLRKGDDIRMDAVLELDVVPEVKRTVLVALAANCPSKRTELLALARKLNYSLWAPHRFLKRAIQEMAK